MTGRAIGFTETRHFVHKVPPAYDRRAMPISPRALPLSLLASVVTTLCAPAGLRAQDDLRVVTPAGFDAAWTSYAEHMRTAPEGKGIIGRSVTFGHDGALVASAHAGDADRATQRAVDSDTIWHWASNTKTLTGIAIMQLRDRGLLTLSDSIIDHVPELRAVHNPFGTMRSITIEHLLSHSAGFRAPTWPWAGEKGRGAPGAGDQDWLPHEPTKWSQIVAMLPYTEVHFEPGSRFSYSNPGIVFLGQVIERLTGEDWEIYVDKNILRPLGMYGSYFDHTPYHLLRYRSNHYTVEQGGRVHTGGFDFDTGITVSNGGLNASMMDMLRYLAFLAGSTDAATQARYDEILARKSLEEMWQPRVPLQPGGDVSTDAGMGLTFFVYPAEGLVGHTGGQKSFVTFTRIDPATHSYAAGAFNTIGRDGPPATGALNAELMRRAAADLFPLYRK